MKKTIVQLCCGLLLVGTISATSCKNKEKAEETNTENTTMVEEETAAPVEISTDEELRDNLKDVTKDFPGVEATVANGEITLTGTIQRDRLQQLMMSLNNLQPKKINNNLNVEG